MIVGECSIHLRMIQLHKQNNFQSNCILHYKKMRKIIECNDDRQSFCAHQDLNSFTK